MLLLCRNISKIINEQKNIILLIIFKTMRVDQVFDIYQLATPQNLINKY